MGVVKRVHRNSRQYSVPCTTSSSLVLILEIKTPMSSFKPTTWSLGDAHAPRDSHFGCEWWLFRDLSARASARSTPPESLSNCALVLSILILPFRIHGPSVDR